MDRATKLRIQKERQTQALRLVKQVTGLLQRTRLNIQVTCQAIHSKNARHMMLGECSVSLAVETDLLIALNGRSDRLPRTDHGHRWFTWSGQAQGVSQSCICIAYTC